MMFYVYTFLGILLRTQVFEVNNGNDDWMDLVHPEKYGLTQTQNFYMKVCKKYQKQQFVYSYFSSENLINL